MNVVRNRLPYRFIRDVQGSVRLVVGSATGLVAQRLDYDAFGNVLLDTNPGFQPFGFQSGLYDPDTALVQFGARWYDAASGRWLSKDPILLEGGLNLYVFCGNDPVNFADPTGLVNWGMVGRGLVGVIANGAMAIGGALLAETGVGAAIAVYGAYQTGASMGNIVNGFLEHEEGPVGPVQTLTQVGMLAGGVDPDSRTWARGDLAATTVDIIIPTVLSGRIDTRLVTRQAGPAGTLSGTLQHVYIPPEEAYGLVRAGVRIDWGLTVLDYGRFGWDEYNKDDCGNCQK